MYLIHKYRIKSNKRIKEILERDEIIKLESESEHSEAIFEFLIRSSYKTQLTKVQTVIYESHCQS